MKNIFRNHLFLFFAMLQHRTELLFPILHYMFGDSFSSEATYTVTCSDDYFGLPYDDIGGAHSDSDLMGVLSICDLGQAYSYYIECFGSSNNTALIRIFKDAPPNSLKFTDAGVLFIGDGVRTGSFIRLDFFQNGCTHSFPAHVMHSDLLSLEDIIRYGLYAMLIFSPLSTLMSNPPLKNASESQSYPRRAIRFFSYIKAYILFRIDEKALSS